MQGPVSRHAHPANNTEIGRICPAREASALSVSDQPVLIRHIEYQIVGELPKADQLLPYQRRIKHVPSSVGPTRLPPRSNWQGRPRRGRL
jgi:hypothetical protein